MNIKNTRTKSMLWIFFIMLTVGILSCSTNDDGYRKESLEVDASLLPEASFTESATTIFVDESVSFMDTSTNNPILWSWTFQGGTPTTSAEQDPVVVYPAAGTFKVTLKARNELGVGEQVVFEDYITVEGIPIPYLADYPFNGDLNDIGLNGINAVSNYGDPIFEDDRNANASSAWLSPGVNGSYLTIPGYKGVSGDAPRTVMAWFKNSEGTNRKTIVSWGTNSGSKMFNVMIHNDRIRIEAGASNMRSVRTGLNDDTWHHIAITYDPVDGPNLSDVIMYIDGIVQEGSPDGPGGSYRSTVTEINTDVGSDVWIGHAIYGGNGYMWFGDLDDVRILDYALLPAEISAAASE